MKRMDFGSNQLEGTIPPNWANFSKLTNISLSFNKISGSIPTVDGMWPNLLEFDIEGNNISGTIPEELYQMSKLDTLILANNSLQGSLSDSIGNLGLLRGIFDVSSNFLDGTIPKVLASLSAVTSIYLDDNLFSGELPCGFAAMSLSVLNISANNFYTTLPECYLDSTSNIVMLYATYANLTGPLPEPATMSSKLTTLALSGNPTEGTLPASWANATKLKIMQMNRMELSGTIPVSYNNYIIKTFSVVDNYLTGEIPYKMFEYGNIYLNGNIGLTGCYGWYYNVYEGSIYCEAYNTSLCCISGGYCCDGIPGCWPNSKSCYLPPTTPSPPPPAPLLEDAAPSISGPTVVVASLAALSIFMTM